MSASKYVFKEINVDCRQGHIWSEMEQAAGEPTEDIPKVSIDTKKVNQNQIRGKSSTYITACH